MLFKMHLLQVLGVQFNGTGTVSIQSDVNSTITDYGVGDYQVNYSNQLKDGNNSTTDYQAISLAITGTVYNVPGQLAHTHPFVYTADKPCKILMLQN